MSANNNPETGGKTPPKPVTGLALLREPFPAHQISKLPKPTKDQTQEVKDNYKKGIRCKLCGAWHHPDVVHLDYVGHAALTDRLLDVDPMWSWEPMAFRDGLPAFDQTGGLWIKLTVCGVTRNGYGHAAAKPGIDPGAREKEVIGDALRNAAMRFGAALDLWHKGDLHADEPGDDDKPKAEPKTGGSNKPPQESGAALAAGVAIDLCKTEAALTKWSATNAEMIAKLDAADKVEVRRLYGLRLEKLRKEGAADPVSADPFSEAA
jgi:hypothetical protein